MLGKTYKRWPLTSAKNKQVNKTNKPQEYFLLPSF